MVLWCCFWSDFASDFASFLVALGLRRPFAQKEDVPKMSHFYRRHRYTERRHGDEFSSSNRRPFVLYICAYLERLPIMIRLPQLAGIDEARTIVLKIVLCLADAFRWPPLRTRYPSAVWSAQAKAGNGANEVL